MKKLSLYLVILFVFSLQACRTKCDKTYYFVADVPVYESIAKVRSSFNVQSKQEIVDVRNIVENETAYFLQEGSNGIHVVQKLGANSVQLVKFISLPSCLDISVTDDYLYVAQGVDILQIDIRDLNNIQKVNTLQEVINISTLKEDSVVVRYEEREVVRVVEDGYCDGQYSTIAEIDPDGFDETQNGPHGQFKMRNGDFLYLIDRNKLSTLRINSDGSLTRTNEVGFGFGFQQNRPLIAGDTNLLVIGESVSDLNIFIISNSPSAPVNFGSANSNFNCGSFVTSGNFIFFNDFTEPISRSWCQSFGRVFIRNISNNMSSSFNNSASFTEALSLGVLNNTLYVCDGSAGFGLYNIGNVTTFTPSSALIGEVTDIHARKAILTGTNALVWGDNGLFYLDAKDPRDIKVISEVK